MKLNLQKKFLLATLSLCIIGLGFLAGISYTLAGRALKSTIAASIDNITATTVKNIDAWLMDRALDIEIWGWQQTYQAAVKDTSIGSEAGKTANLYLSRLKDKYPYYEDICVANLEGDIVAGSDASVVGKVKVTNREYFKTALKGQLDISDVVKSQKTGKPIFPIAGPIREKNEIIGVVFGIVDVDHFTEQFIDPIKVGETGYAYIYQDNGMVIAHPHRKKVLKINMKDLDFGREMIAQKEGWSTYIHDGVEKIVNYKALHGMPWTLGVGAVTSELYAPVKRLGYILGAVSLSMAIIAVFVILLLVRSIVNPITRIAKGLYDAGNQVASASGQVSSASQSLAEGSSEQAASLEETSSSLEEMSSMTKQNADNASQADHLMKEASRVMGSANASMKEMAASMDDISTASGQTSKIIKTIDEIAFQTNLLALNAAVEAARAGEAGAGFAVVADEVKNLAMRSAEAARNTADLIEGTVKKVADGSMLVDKTNEGFAAMADSSGKVAELVAEIAAASNEQARGIEQVNTAVMDMDKVTQQNAANAEESASASEEMNAQAEQMKVVVGELVAIVGGNGTGAKQAKARKNSSNASLPVIEKRPAVKNAVADAKNEISPQQAIPMEADDFKDF